MTQFDRTQNFIKQYQILKPDIKVTSQTTIKGQTIEKICQFEGERPYGRLLRWVENKIKENEKAKYESNSPKLFDKPKKERKKRVKVMTVDTMPRLHLSEVLISYKLGKITLEETAFIIKDMYKN